MSLRLLIDRATGTLWDKDERRALVNVTRDLKELEWTHKTAEGGCQDGRARIRLSRDSPAFEELVERGRSGLGWIWWVRDPGAADAEDAETDLLWLGMVEDAEADHDSEEVSLRLRGVSTFLETSYFTATYELEKITEIVQDILQAAIADPDNPVQAMDVDTDGVMQRKVTLSFDRTPVKKALQDVAKLLGGPSVVGWGVRPSDDQDDFATGYFKLWKGHLYEKATAGDPPQLFGVPLQKVTELSRRSSSKDLRNVVRVIGGEIPGTGTPPKFYTAEAIAAESVAEFGRRELLVEESSLLSNGQCAFMASAIAEARSSLTRETEFTAVLLPAPGPTDGTQSKGLIRTTLINGGRFAYVRDAIEGYLPWGDGRRIVRNRQDSDGLFRNYSRIVLSGAPTGANAPLFDLNSALSPGDRRMYVILGERPNVHAAAPNILELDRGIGLRWNDTGGGNFQMQIGYRATSGTWTAISSLPATFTAAELANPHLAVLCVQYESALLNRYTAYHYDQANGATAMASGVIPVASIHSSATPNLVYLNAAFSVAVDSFVTSASQSDDYDIAYFAVLNDYNPAAIGTDVAAIGLGELPFRRYGNCLLHTNFAHIDPGDPDAALVRYAYGQTSPASSYDHKLWSGHTNGYVEDSSVTPSWRSYSWLCGQGRGARKLGTHHEVIPATARFKYLGPGLGIEASVSGISSAHPATELLKQTNERLATVAENARGGK